MNNRKLYENLATSYRVKTEFQTQIVKMMYVEKLRQCPKHRDLDLISIGLFRVVYFTCGIICGTIISVFPYFDLTSYVLMYV